MSDLSTFKELSPLLETQVWAVYQTQKKMFATIGGWQSTPHFFEDQKTALAMYECLGQNDYPHSIVIGFDVSPTHAIVPSDSKAPNVIEAYVVQRQAATIEQHLPASTPIPNPRKNKL